ncbi:hypothetical protein BO99DRAFT_455430 [Aspergillus violaceofuscus CBS 115571]|uniref:Uncharacterized protein n=1 Tax=Aspergillus violaceofuscus (strain CBS 115571) TaxID=1450538 RepID=A0A2V5HQR6_ASPV1|nr:hypothetical protein BO99DRAFT_455430 [Aspergillus violaceofuscus CBS 115571]
MLFLILSLFCTYTHALTKFDTNCTLPAETVNYVSAPNTRGTLTILWASMFMILSCTWTVQHPDVPQPREVFGPGRKGSIEYWGHKYGSQMLWFVITILAPEVLLAKYGLCDEAGFGITWTKTTRNASRKPHEFQEILRVLNTIEDDPPCSPSASRRGVSMQTLTSSSSNIDFSYTPVFPPVRNATAQLGYRYSLKSRDILRLRKAGLLSQLPDITKEELEDRSKADWMLRSITVLQIVWMGFQTSVRLQASLEVTHLEVSALAFALCAIWICVLTWNMPKKVQVPITIMEFTGGGEQVFEASGLGRSASTIHQNQQNPLLMEYLEFLLSPEQGRQKLHALLMVLFGGLSFGSIHLLAWNFPFPSAFEQTLWRTTALYCTLTPLFVCVPHLSVYLSTLFIRDGRERLDAVGDSAVMLISCLPVDFILASLYCLARLCLLVEMFRTLAYQPPVMSTHLPGLGPAHSSRVRSTVTSTGMTTPEASYWSSPPPPRVAVTYVYVPRSQHGIHCTVFTLPDKS